MPIVTLINDDAPADNLYGDHTLNQTLPVYGRLFSLLLIDPNPQTCLLVRRACESRGYPVQTVSIPQMAIQMYRDRPASMVICEFGLAQSCLQQIRSLPEGRQAQVLITSSGDLNSLKLRRYAHSVHANGLLSWPFSIIDLIDTIEQAGYASRRRPASPADPDTPPQPGSMAHYGNHPSEMCLQNLAMLCDLWQRKLTGTFRTVNPPFSGMTLLDGELIALFGEDLQKVLSGDLMCFDAQNIRGTVQEGVLAREMFKIALRSQAPNILLDFGHQILKSAAVPAGIPLSDDTRHLLQMDEPHPLNTCIKQYPEQSKTILQELWALQMLGMLHFSEYHGSGSVDPYRELRTDILRSLHHFRAGHIAEAVGMPTSAEPSQIAAAKDAFCKQLLQRSTIPDLPADLQDSIRQLISGLQAQTNEQPKPDVRQIQYLLQEVDEHIAIWNWDQALRTLKRVLDLDPHHAYAMALTGRVHYNQSRSKASLQLAQDMLQQSLQHNPQTAQTHYYMALVWQAQNRSIDARSAAAEACRLDPVNETYSALRAELEQL